MRAVSATSRSGHGWKSWVAGALLALSVVGCEGSNQYGECVGLNDADRKPNLHYRTSTRNVILGAIFIETIFAPIVVLVSELYCPDGVIEPAVKL